MKTQKSNLGQSKVKMFEEIDHRHTTQPQKSVTPPLGKSHNFFLLEISKAIIELEYLLLHGRLTPLK